MPVNFPETSIGRGKNGKLSVIEKTCEKKRKSQSAGAVRRMTGQNSTPQKTVSAVQIFNLVNACVCHGQQKPRKNKSHVPKLDGSSLDGKTFAIPKLSLDFRFFFRPRLPSTKNFRSLFWPPSEPRGATNGSTDLCDGPVPRHATILGSLVPKIEPEAYAH